MGNHPFHSEPDPDWAPSIRRPRRNTPPPGTGGAAGAAAGRANRQGSHPPAEAKPEPQRAHRQHREPSQPQQYFPPPPAPEPAQRPTAPSPPELVDVHIQPPGNISCQGRYTLTTQRVQGHPVWAGGGYRIYSNEYNYWLIGAAREMAGGAGWFASLHPHGGHPPCHASVAWAHVVKGGDGSWKDPAPIRVLDPRAAAAKPPPPPAPPPRPAAPARADYQIFPWSGSPDAYEMVKKLGEGAYGVVYLARRRKDGKELIIKQPKFHGDNDPDSLYAEAERLRSLNHTHITHFIDAYRDRHGVLHMVTEYADGGDLWAQLQRYRPQGGIPPHKVMRWFGETCDAIRYLHSHSMMHRDIKPDNIFLTKEGSVKVGDLGLGKQLARHGPSAATHTVFIPGGGATYMAPELLGEQRHTVAIDVWALGCLLYELSTGRTPFRSPAAVIQQQVPRDAPPYAAPIVARLLVPVHSRPTVDVVCGLVAEAVARGLAPAAHRGGGYGGGAGGAQYAR